MEVTIWRVVDLLENTVVQEGVVIDSVYGYISVSE